MICCPDISMEIVLGAVPVGCCVKRKCVKWPYVSDASLSAVGFLSCHWVVLWTVEYLMRGPKWNDTKGFLHWMAGRLLRK